MTDSAPPVLLLDVNVLVSLSVASHQHHRAAHRALADMESWATTPFTEAAFLRLMMNKLVVGQQLASGEVLNQLRAMRRDARWRFLVDDTSLADPRINPALLMGHGQVTDFHLVNVAACNDGRLATFDRSLVAALAPVDRRHVELLSV